MGSGRNLDAVADACIEAGRQIEQHGSPALKQAMRVVLYILGRELAQRAERNTQPDGRASAAEPFSRIVGKRGS